MMQQLSRRAFLNQSIKVNALAAVAPATLMRPLHAGSSEITIGLSQYSLRALFQSGELGILDYPKLMKMITGSGFKGIVAIEYEGSRLSPVNGVKATQALLRRTLKAS